MSQTEIEEIELSIEEAKKMVEKADRALRLASNPDFRTLILEGYFVNEASRLVLLSSDPNLNEDQRAMVQRDMLGIGGVKRYLATMVQMGKIAQQSISEAQHTLEEIRMEELELNSVDEGADE